MSDDEWESLQNSMLDHEFGVTIENNPDLNSKDYLKRVINKSWIYAGKSRKAIRDRIMKKYGEGVEISNTAWDTEEDVNAMGWDDYNGSKGFSTDMYVKVTTKDGEDIMDEVSLKKDVKINFLNSSTVNLENGMKIVLVVRLMQNNILIKKEIVLIKPLKNLD